ncbi:MAG TPA: sulfur carrier protein ThiS [bacterium]|nr:sulfur carrier protein ThiS [bacterium]
MIIKIGQEQKNIKSVTVDQLIDELGVKRDNIAVVRNGIIIKKKDWVSEKLCENDRIDIFSPVSGG